MKTKEVNKRYIRDGRSPVPSSERISRVMSANKATETGPEKLLRKALWSIGERGYRKNWKKALGKPDIAYPKRKIAVFVHGCFWHRCPNCRFPLPRTNTSFWKEKFRRNRIRDRAKKAILRSKGWKVFEVWECEIERDSGLVAQKLRKSFFR